MDLNFVPYFTVYLLLFCLWFVRANRQIMFWLYLWQLKEYHWGRFLDHFRTAKGRGIFLNHIFLGKMVLLGAGMWLFVLPVRGRTVFFDANSLYDFAGAYFLPLMGYIGIALAIFGAEAIYTAYCFLTGRLLHPRLTRKSVLLIGASHLAMYGVSLVAFFLFLGELKLLELCFAVFSLLLLDILAPVLIGAVVLGLQPLTLMEKNRILMRAKSIIDSRPNLTVIGVAGSYGKSGVKELLAHILSQKYKVLKTRANQNTEMGVAQTIIDGLKPEHEIFVCEIGAVYKGKIAQTAGIASPRIGILTGVNQQHLGVFGNQKNIIDAKFELLEALPENGAAILNFGCPLVRDGFEAKKIDIGAQKIIFAGKDIFASDIETKIDNLSFILNYQDQKIQINTNARGAWMAETIVLSIAGAIGAGMEFATAAAIVNQTDFAPFNIVFKRVRPFLDQKGRTLLKEINILDSSYSANPDGVAAHLDYLKLWPGKKAIVMPCLIELGSASKEVHYSIGKKISEVCDLAIITTKERFGDIEKGAIAAGMPPENVIFCDNPEKMMDKIKSVLGTDGTVILEGRLSDSIIAAIKE